MRLSECRGQTCLNYAEHEHLRRSQLGVAIRDESIKPRRGTYIRIIRFIHENIYLCVHT